ncbi:beta-lactamase-like [Bradysia coprophila]|uniref:beta-lactamase-like n=1 Tax=Bradysia coprophila TaxID=38358 RepID=UPI00187D7E09|nr:beta-lactamase-like [Bradysia coprophila]
MRLTINLTLATIILLPCVLGDNDRNQTTAAVLMARELVKSFLNGTVNGLTPGLVIGVSVKGEQKWLEGFGLANIENNVTMSSEAAMQIGSITKSYTVAVASRLLDNGKLSFDAPIREYLSYDDLPDKMWNDRVVNITLRQLFQMTSGFPAGPSEEELGTCLRCRNQTGRLAFVRDRDLEFEPGTNFTYSNYGTELAGAVIEKVLQNKTFNDAFTEMVRDILRLNNTAMINTTLVTPNLASFYTTNMETVYNSGMWNDIFLNDFHAAGGIISTISDVLVYGQAWLDAYYGRGEHFLKQSTVKEAWTPSGVTPSPYGLGWVIQNVTDNRPSGNQVVWHNGGTLGCRSILAIYPETEVIVAASVNLVESPIDLFVLEGVIADLFANITRMDTSFTNVKTANVKSSNFEWRKTIF